MMLLMSGYSLRLILIEGTEKYLQALLLVWLYTMNIFYITISNADVFYWEFYMLEQQKIVHNCEEKAK